MSKILCYDSDGNYLDHFTQWDIGQKITITGLAVANSPEFHFCNLYSTEALVVSSTIDGESIIAEVPDVLLQAASPLTIHVYYQSDEHSAKTVYTFAVPVSPRQKPADYTYEEKRTDCSVLLNLIYPVGALYLSTNNISPDIFLIGRWEQVNGSFLTTSDGNNIAIYVWRRVL